MSAASNIEWTDATWNIARGCSKVDEDCKFCYMYRDSMNGTRYNPLSVLRTKTVFDLPLKLPGSKKIFTSSLTDFFHPSIDPYRKDAWDIIRKCPQHTFQILTKRPERIVSCLPYDWGSGWKNVWLGTSVGSSESIDRIISLSRVDAALRFLSLEPLHGEILLDKITVRILDEDWFMLPAFDWVIVGGESGNENGKYRYRPCNIDWISEIVSACQKNQIPVFVKQLGTFLSKQLMLSDRHGRNITEFPSHLQVREFPIIRR